MAKKLYVFGIGGTGSRVLKALVMLLASGCRLNHDFDMLIPILIDPDTGNGDLNRTKDILRLYQEIRNQIKEPDDFFGQEIKTINELSDNANTINPEYFQFKLKGIEQSTFGQYIGFDSLSEDFQKDDKNFTRSFYSVSNLKSNLDVGFKGNPNMGSIVQNQFTVSEDFQRFSRTFSDGDAVFIINSIFGGTGASGFPLLLKTLRGNSKLSNHAKIKTAKIGGITYLPYFALDKQDEVMSDSFEDKAKAAIDYYNRTIINQKQIDFLYFIGNKGNTNHHKYSVGGKEQKNDAHFLELAGALAVFDFCRERKGGIDNTVIKEFGIENDTDNISFDDLNIQNSKEISSHLTKFKLYSEYLNTGLSKALGVSRWTKSNIKWVGQSKNSLLDQYYFNSAEYKTQIEAFNKYFMEWLNEMTRNKPAFSPFNSTSWDTALNLIKNKTPEGNKSFRALDVENNHLIEKMHQYHSPEKAHTALLKLFGRTTENILNKRNLLIK